MSAPNMRYPLPRSAIPPDSTGHHEVYAENDGGGADGGHPHVSGRSLLQLLEMTERSWKYVVETRDVVMAVEGNEENGEGTEERATDVEHLHGLRNSRVQDEETEDNADSAEHGEDRQDGNKLEIIDG